MKKIGFVDDYLSEWHANNYPTWIENANAVLHTDYTVAYAWAERDISPVDGVSTDQWCAAHHVTRCETIGELCELSDCIIVLAPSDPDRHLSYAEQVLPCGKPTYIDKTFAPDSKIAREIFDLAAAYHTPFFSTSALRFAAELDRFHDVENLIITAGGSSVEEYIIHPVEMAVKLLREPAASVHTIRQGTQRIYALTTKSGKHATITLANGSPYTIAVESADGTLDGDTITSDFFTVLLREILRFFETAETPFDPRETLLVMQWRDAILHADAE